MMAPENNPLPRWEGLLRELNPVREAERLSRSVVDPATATADQCWELIWNKPLFANTRVEYGEKAVEKLRLFMPRAWRDWGESEGAFTISHRDGGNQRDNFNVSGHRAADIDALGIARHRLLAIQGGARLLRSLVQEAPDHPFKPLTKLELGAMVTRIRTLAGRGWGHITALHLLTDFGLAVKPDRHLVHSVKALGRIRDLPEGNVPSLADALRINEAVDKCGEQIFGDGFGPAQRRYLDKILMELSRQGLLNQLMNKEVQ